MSRTLPATGRNPQPIASNPRRLTLAEARQLLATAQQNTRRWPRNTGFYWDYRYYRRLVMALEADTPQPPQSPTP